MTDPKEKLEAHLARIANDGVAILFEDEAFVVIRCKGGVSENVSVVPAQEGPDTLGTSIFRLLGVEGPKPLFVTGIDPVLSWITMAERLVESQWFDAIDGETLEAFFDPKILESVRAQYDESVVARFIAVRDAIDAHRREGGE